MPHVGHFLQSDVPQAAYLFNSPLYGRVLVKTSMVSRVIAHLLLLIVRASDPPKFSTYTELKPPFVITGAPNVFLETVKRGLDDDFSASDTNGSSIVLRVYEAFSGHGRVTLRIGSHIPVQKVTITNLLEDVSSEKELKLVEGEEDGDFDAGLSTTLDFRGFEVKTVKILLGHKAVIQDGYALITFR